MKKIILNSIILILISGISAYAEQPDWFVKLKKIKLFSSTKADVEKLFENAQMVKSENLDEKFKFGWGKSIKYVTEEGILEAEFSTGKCAESQSKYGYDVAADVVVGFTFTPNQITYDNQLRLDLNMFERKTDSNMPEIYTLTSDELGLFIVIDEAKVGWVTFYISKSKENEKFACRNLPEVKEPDWLVKLRKLEIFKSTRAEVENVFGNPKINEIKNLAQPVGGWGLEIEYETEEGKLNVWYSTGTCAESRSRYGYDIDKDVVSEITFYPKNRVDFTEMNFDLREFKSEPIIDIQSAYNHRNDNLGVELYMIDGKIENIEFYLKEEQKQLDCVKVLNLKR